jgi:hypothetical protein
MSLEFETLRGYQGETLILEHDLYILALRSQGVRDLVKDRSLVGTAVSLTRYANTEVKHLIVNLGIAADKVVIFQNLSDTHNSGDLSALVRRRRSRSRTSHRSSGGRENGGEQGKN